MLDERNLKAPELVFEPGVFVVAKTVFLGMPDRWFRAGLSPCELKEAVRAKGQDQGSDAERLIEFAGRGCYDSYGRGRPSKAFHENIKTVRHGSVLEHCSWTFWIEGVSRGLTHELVRHRVGTGISQRSTRYTDEGKSRVIVPPIFIVEKEDSWLTSSSKRSCQQVVLYSHRAAKKDYQFLNHTALKLAQDQSPPRLRDLQRRQLSPTQARKCARGAARSTLGQDVETCLTWTVNLRSLINAACQRYSEYAEPEIRRLFGVLLDTVAPDVPHYLGDLKKIMPADGLGHAADPDSLWPL